MNIGDRVRVIRGHEEGIITKFLPHNQIEIEIEDGFRIPVLKNEVTLVAKEEAIWLRPTKPKQEDDLQSKAQKIVAEMGFFVAFLPLNDQSFVVYVINNTDLEIMCSVGELKTDYRGIKAFHLKKRSFEKLNEMELKDFEKWGGLLFQALFFRQGFAIPKDPLTKRISFKADSFFKSKQTVPLMDKQGFVFQLDRENIQALDMASLQENVKPLNPTVLRENMLGKKETVPIKPTPKLKNEIDLHTEALFGDKKIDKTQILGLQLAAFDHYIDKAVAAGLAEVTIIHGVGNGILKNEVQKRLSRMRNDTLIQYYQDARKERFGYGATYVKIH